MGNTFDFSSGFFKQVFTKGEAMPVGETREGNGWGHFLLITVVMMALYFLTGKLTFSISDNSLSHKLVSIVVFLPEGFALAGVLIFGRSVWLGVFLGQLALAVSVGLSWEPALGISAVNSLEAVLAAYLIAYMGLDRSLRSVRSVTRLMLLVILVLQPFSALLGHFFLQYFSIVSSQDLYWSIFSWWFGNSLAQLLIAPMLVYLFSRRDEVTLRDFGLVFLFFLLLNYVVLDAYPIQRLALLLAITMPLVMLLAVYKGICHATVATTTIALSTIYATNLGFGAFAHGSAIDNVVDINFYIASHVFLVLFVGTLLEEKKQTQALIIKRNEDLQELVKLQGQVESMNRHDMKNPLSVAINAPGMVLATEPSLSDESRKMLEMGRKGGYMVLEMINRSLDLYKLEAGTYALRPAKIDLVAILGEVIAQENLSGEDRGGPPKIVLESGSIKEGDGLWAYGEALLCHSLFSNLLRNALDASTSGAPVTVQAGGSEVASMVEVVISNEGSVPADIKEHFFDKLVTRNKEQGTGFGTYSARLCVEVQGGTIALDCSHEGRTNITVRLPAFAGH
ncbi:MAG: sensor histidine kinase [bacterium]